MYKRMILSLIGIVPLAALLFAGSGDVFEDLSFDEALDKSAQTRQDVLVKFDAKWCHYCRTMDVKTFNNAGVEQELADYISIKVDIDTPEGRELARQFRVRGTPHVAVINADRQVIYNRPGYQGPEDLLKALAALE